MRVSHVITRLIVGGAQENTVSTVVGLSRIPGVTIDLISGPSEGREGSLEAETRRAGVSLRILPELIRPIRPWTDFIALQKLTAIYRESKPDIVHTHSGKAGILGRLAAARAGVRVIVHTIHGPSFGPFQGPLSNFIFRAAEKAAGKRTTHFSVVATAMAEQYLAAGIGQPDHYTQIFSGFPLEPFLSAQNDAAARARWGLSPDDFVIGKIARLFELKGHEDLLKVAPQIIEKIPRARFLLVGDGPWRGRFEDMVRERGLEKHVVFTGLVRPTEIPSLVGIMDLLVHLSLREGLPRALPQALATGKPVIAYDCDGAGEVCLNGETGWLLRPGDLEGLRQRVIELARDPAQRDALGSRGRAFVSERFPVERMVQDTHELYKRLLR